MNQSSCNKLMAIKKMQFFLKLSCCEGYLTDVFEILLLSTMKWHLTQGIVRRQTSLKAINSSHANSFYSSICPSISTSVPWVQTARSVPVKTQVEHNSKWHPTNDQWRANEQKWGAKWLKTQGQVATPSDSSWVLEGCHVHFSKPRPISHHLSCSLCSALDNIWHDIQSANTYTGMMFASACVCARSTYTTQGWLMDARWQGCHARVVMHFRICLPRKWCMS